PFQVEASTPGAEGPALRNAGRDADDVEGLLPLPPGSGRLVAQALELRGEVEARQLVAPGRGTAPFESVRGEKADGRFQRVARDVLLGRAIDGRRNAHLTGEDRTGDDGGRDSGARAAKKLHGLHLR